jgi:hypothetical protein
MAKTETKSRDKLVSRVCPNCGKRIGQCDFIGHYPVLVCSECGPLLIGSSKSDEGRVTAITEQALSEAKQLHSLAAASWKADFMGPVN